MTATPTPRPVQLRVVHAERLPQTAGGTTGPPCRLRSEGARCRPRRSRQRLSRRSPRRRRSEQAAQQAVRTDDRRRPKPRARVVVGELREILAVNDGGQRIERFVLAEDLIAVRGQALAHRSRLPGRTRMMTRCGSARCRRARRAAARRVARRWRCGARARRLRPERRRRRGPPATIASPNGNMSKPAFHASFTRVGTRMPCPEMARPEPRIRTAQQLRTPGRSRRSTL